MFDTLRDALSDRYAMERELGRGGMATVYLAQDLKHRRQVAIKVLHSDVAAAIGQERFVREIEIAAQLQHPHILPLYDSGEAGGYLFYVMPFVDGESLRDRLGREKQLSQEEVIKITSEVASALGYAHSRGIVHRDIKPENIMLSGSTAIVADFGIARPASADQHQLTQAGTVIGTAAYMSPEQATGSADIDGRSDQYALACVAYELVVGEPPFTGPTAQAIMARHTMDAVSPPSIVRDSIPDTMETALLRALAKVPADRYPTIMLFAEALARPSGTTAAMRRRSTMGTTAIGRQSITVQVPIPGWRPVLRYGVPAVALLLTAWFTRGLWWGRHGAATAQGPDPRRIAVLYFQDRSPGRTLGYLADGLTEALIYQLSQAESLQVISRNGVAPYRDAKVSPDSIARALRVGTLIDGTVSQDGNQVRVNVEMTNTANDSVISSPPLTRVREDLFALQDELAKEVSQSLRARLGKVVRDLQVNSGTSNVAAWEHVLQADAITKTVDSILAAGDSAGATRALARADGLLAQASTMDKKWVVPIVRRGWLAFDQRKIVGWDKGPATEWTGHGLDFASQALKVQHDPEALRLRGTMRYIRWLLGLDPFPLTARQLLDSAAADL
ncbi:MAG TPA: serine/threonine-protein kinase, partial [Gemmatimonadales bacterium]